MKRNVYIIATLVVFLFQCSHYDDLQRNGKESKNGSTESHNFGQDCMDCHNDPGSEAVKEGGWFHIAGSIYDEDETTPYTNARVELWSQPNGEGTKYYELEVDAYGNFYTEKVIDYNHTCYPIVVDLESGDYEAMEPAFNSGGCNGCHGKTEVVISVE